MPCCIDQSSSQIPSAPVKWVDHIRNTITVDKGTTVLDLYKLGMGGEGWLSDGRDHINRKEGVDKELKL